MPAAPAAEPEQKPAEEKKPPEVLAELKIEKGCRPIIVPVTIKGKEYKFLLDTGCSGSFFDASFEGSLLKRGLFDEPRVADVQGISASGGFRIYRAPEAYLGKLDLRAGGSVACMDLTWVREHSGRDIRGQIGRSFLEKHIVRLDFDEGLVRFLKPGSTPQPDWGEPVHLKRGATASYVTLAVSGMGNVDFELDTGCVMANGLLPSGPLSKAVGSGSLTEVNYDRALGTGPKRWSMGRVQSLTIGSVEHKSVHFLAGGGGKGDDPLLGMGVLCRYVLTIDYPNEKIYFQKGRSFDKPDEWDMSGMEIWCVGGHNTVGAVLNEGPAEKAGIKPQDLILKVNDKSAAEMDFWDLRDLLKSGDGKEIKMTIKRGDEEQAVSFKLKKRI
jgi:hypothetical protein